MLSARHLLYPLTMSEPSIYPDSFQDDEDVRRVLAALWLGHPTPSPPVAVSAASAVTVFPRPAGGPRRNEVPIASTSSQPVHLAPKPRETGKDLPTNPFKLTITTAVLVSTPSPLVAVTVFPRPAGGPRRNEVPIASTSSQPVHLAPKPRETGKDLPTNPIKLTITTAVLVSIPTVSITDDVYYVASGKRTGVRETWYVLPAPISIDIDQLLSCRADAGEATQGVPGGQVVKYRVTPPKRRHKKCTAYVVFEGLAPGVYNTW
jgi:hypothetical protein